MRTRRFISLTLGVLAGFPVGSTFAARDKGLEILITADAIPSPEGFRPKPGKPVYYLLFQSRTTLGEVIANVKLPDSAAVERAVVAELAKQGFVRTQEGGPMADIVSLAVLGDSNFKIEFNPKGKPYLDPDFAQYMDQVNVRQVIMNLGLWGMVPDTVEGLFSTLPEKIDIYPSRDSQIADAQEAVVNAALTLRNREPHRKRYAIKTLVGANKVERAVANRTLSGTEAERIASAAFDNRFYLSLSAVEAKKQPDGGRTFLWRTTMLIDWREDFTKALPDMLAQAGPSFGVDVAVPGFVNTAKPREGKVEIGDTKVVKEPDSATESRAKK
jgi:hypothetical protein